METRARRWMSVLAGLAAGALSTILLVRGRKTLRGEKSLNNQDGHGSADRWARPGMSVTFRAELMPGRARAERTFRVVGLMSSGRVTLEGFAGEHTETEFETLR